MKEEQPVDSAVFLCDVGFLINHHCCVACLTGKVSREKVQKKNNVNMIAKLFAIMLSLAVHQLSKDISQAINGTLFSVLSSKDGRMSCFRGFSSLYVERFKLCDI